MSKLLWCLGLALVVWFWYRLGKRRQRATTAPPLPGVLVVCTVCGCHLPRTDADVVGLKPSPQYRCRTHP